MSTTPTPESIVVVSEEKKRRKGLLWVAGGAALLLAGGSTFALWSASDTFGGGTITAGDLNIVKKTDAAFWDVSADRTDQNDKVGEHAAHAINSIDSWRIVPGDKIAAEFNADITLEGDNLVAKVDLASATGGDLESAFTDGNLTYTYEVYWNGGKGPVQVVEETDLGGANTLFYLSAVGAGQEHGADDHTIQIEDGMSPVAEADAPTTVLGMPGADVTSNFSVVVFAEFHDVNDRTDVTAKDVLSDLQLDLSQVRDTGAQFPSVP